MKWCLSLLLTVAAVLVSSTVGTNSYCMTDCSNRQHGLSLYQQICCQLNNLGKTNRLQENGHVKIIDCPPERLASCPVLEIKEDCKDWYEANHITSGVYTINPDGGTPFEVYYDMETNGGGWTVFQRRQDGSVDFNLNWVDYERGFGNLTGEFWLGLTKIQRLTKDRSNTLRVDLGDFESNTAYAQYSTFNISDITTEYTLTVEGYSGTAGDGLITDNTHSNDNANHNGQKFSTKDNDNDKDSGNCAMYWQGAWWFNICFQSHLNAPYSHISSVNRWSGIIWVDWKERYYSLKFTEMKLRSNN